MRARKLPGETGRVSDCSRDDVRKSRLALFLALSAIGLIASLVPATEHVFASTGPPVEVLDVPWPGSGVQQSLGNHAFELHTARVWVTARPGAGEVRIDAALVVGPDSRPIRQFSFDAQPTTGPYRPTTLQFATGEIPREQDIRLQLSVAPDARDPVSIGVAAADGGFARPTLNGVPAHVGGPLAFELGWRGRGINAALKGAGSELARLIAAAVLAAFAPIVWPRTGRVAWNMPRRYARRGRQAALSTWQTARLLRRIRATRSHVQPASAATGPRLFVYPWLMALFPVASFAASNVVWFRLWEAVLIAAAALAAVSILMLGLTVVLRDMARAAALSALAVAVFGGYGHTAEALRERGDDRFLLPVTVVLALAAALWILRHARAARVAGSYLNYVSLALAAVPSLSLTFQLVGAATIAQADDPLLSNPGLRQPVAAVPEHDMRGRPDIYYIIVDGYPRADGFVGFDNTDFVEALAERGFYVAGRATSNYMWTMLSLTSSLNMAYLDDFEGRGSDALPELIERGQDHAVGRSLKALGYTYFHIGTGWPLTRDSPIADVIVDFGPDRVSLTVPQDDDTLSLSPSALRVTEFSREYARTTLLRPILPSFITGGRSASYPWWHPNRAIAAFEFLRELPATDGPKFVFAHIIKPHCPCNIDRRGNIAALDVHDGFTVDHDPSLGDPFLGQVIWVNQQILATMDAILASSASPPVIVLTSDHGRQDWWPHRILAAYYLPGQPDGVVYPTISSVNSLRVVLDHYLGMGLDRLPDLNYIHEQDQFSFQISTDP